MEKVPLGQMPWIWFALAIGALVTSFVVKSLSIMFLLAAIVFCLGGIAFVVRRR
jgi:hypothetical protein